MRHAGLVLGALRHVLTALLPGIECCAQQTGLEFVARNQTIVVQTAAKPKPNRPARQQLLPNSRLGYVSTWYHKMTVSTISEFGSRHIRV
jgi:cytochrome oxidase assembly protein ShyY1